MLNASLRKNTSLAEILEGCKLSSPQWLSLPVCTPSSTVSLSQYSLRLFTPPLHSLIQLGLYCPSPKKTLSNHERNPTSEPKQMASPCFYRIMTHLWRKCIFQTSLKHSVLENSSAKQAWFCFVYAANSFTICETFSELPRPFQPKKSNSINILWES